MTARKTAAAFLLAACCAVPAFADPNPAYDSWAKCKPGASTTVKGTTEAMGQKTEMTIVTKLVSVDPDKVTIETSTSMSMMGQTMPAQTHKQDVPKELPKMPTSMPNGAAMPDVKKGQETITVMGKQMACETSEVNTEQNGTKVTAKSWTCPDVPGVVKIVTSTSGGMASTSTMELVDFKDGK